MVNSLPITAKLYLFIPHYLLIKFKKMKKTVFSLAIVLLTLSTITTKAASTKKISVTESTIKEKAAKKQVQIYGEDATTEWHDVNKGFIASFVKDDKQGSAAYDEKGNWVYTIFRYTEDKMNDDLRDNVKSVYYMYQITGVEQIEQPGLNTVYLIHLENKNDIKTVRVEADDMQVVEQLTRG